MRRLLISSALIALSLVLQTTVLPRVTIFGASIDLILIFSLMNAFLFNPESGAVFGFFGGMAMDLLGGIPGLLALSNTLAAFFGGILERTLKVEEKLLLTSLFGALFIMRQLAYGFSLFLAGYSISFPSIPTLIISVILNCTVFFILFNPIKNILSEKAQANIIGGISARRTSSL